MTLFDHIAIGTARIADAPAFLVGELGGVPDAARPSDGFRWATWRFDGGGCLEILEPMGKDGFLHRFLARRGPGVHHVTFKVPSLAEACERAEARGYMVVGRDESDPGWMEAFLHPRQALGIVVQLVEARPSPAGRVRQRWAPPPGPSNPPRPVTLLGLRMRAHARERACAQWEFIAQGERSEGRDGRLVFRWPPSPMRISVELDASREEGPICVEVATARPLSLPAGPHPVLGAVFSHSAA